MVSDIGTDDVGDSRLASPRPKGVDVALAVARERLSEVHLKETLAFIEFTQADIVPPRALSIYARLHHLSEEEHRNLRNRVLATYDATTEDAATKPATFVAINGDVEWDITASLFNRIRKRLGGRRNFRLRRRVELFSGRVETVIARVHVDNLCRLTQCFPANTAVSDVLQLYMDELHVRRALHHTIYIGTLDRLFADLGRMAPDAEDAGEMRDPPQLKMIPGSRRSG